MEEAKKKAETIATFGTIERYVAFSESLGKVCPTTAKELVHLLTEEDPKFAKEPFVDAEKGQLKDAWGNEIIMVFEEGRILKFVSGGPDGKWDGGKGDDMVAEIHLPPPPL